MSRRARIFWAALRVGLGAVFVYASLHKILEPGAFAHEVHNYKLLPGALINPFAIVLPWLELFCGLALIANRWLEAASALIALMMAAFTVAVASAVARDLNISCGCFKSGGSAANAITVARDVALTVAAVLFAVHAWTREKWNSPT
jgi:putative oxidoreductase